MKTILLMRHAKSSWKETHLADHDRPLNSRGRSAAPIMGEHLSKIALVPDVIVCSTAARARQTVEYLLETLPFEGEVVYTRDLYHSGTESFLEEIAKLDQRYQCAMLVGHNPGMEMAVEDLTGEWIRMPTASVARIDFEVDLWDEITEDSSGKLGDVWIPRDFS